MINTSNTLRVSGLASGMNTDEIVDSLVRAQSARLYKMQQTKTWTTWKTDAYRDVNKKVDEFNRAMRDLRLQSSFNKQIAISTNESILSATVSGKQSLSSYEIKDVQPAKPATTATVKFFLSTGLDPSKTLAELGVEDGSADGTGKTSIRINGVAYEFNLTDTLSTVLSEITNNSPITASYSATEKSFTFSNDMAGEGFDIKLEEGNSNLLAQLGLTAGSITEGSYQSSPNMSVIKGTNASPAKMWINGLEFRSDTNSFTYDGVTFTIKGATEIGQSVNIMTKNDTDAIFNRIKTFVDKYNELIKDLNDRLTEKRYRDYPPLLDEQKKEMKENEIKLWEEKAKSGLLANDSTISSFLAEMRNSLSTMVQNDGAFHSLKEIGIDFSSNYLDKGKLELNEEKLKAVLQSNLEDVKILFTTKAASEDPKSTTVNNKNIHDQSGFAWRIYERLNETTSQLIKLSGSISSSVDTQSFMAKQLKNLDENINREQVKIKAYEERLWRQFTAMEKALQQMNSQSSWLYQQLGM
ncbi:flagellar filament capping protein FliD [Bacillus thermocopriae]|uniref:Flagellar hook-associated protein 2 n=1 Tax=Neobacillus thermocopriae TaxID=1215031 RepID=A0A6B3TNV2_9BACI|nr:flagellar filament capping protein FliD [Neobacillus thermocopriae]NEX78066.1 flagellar filament capping protein FliD [Neobacillus thermocopriae]